MCSEVLKRFHQIPRETSLEKGMKKKRKKNLSYLLQLLALLYTYVSDGNGRTNVVGTRRAMNNSYNNATVVHSREDEKTLGKLVTPEGNTLVATRIVLSTLIFLQLPDACVV